MSKELATKEMRTGIYEVEGTDIKVLVDTWEVTQPLAVSGEDLQWWLTKTQVANLITTLTKALQEAP